MLGIKQERINKSIEPDIPLCGSAPGAITFTNLRDAGDLHHVGVTNKTAQELSAHQRIFQIVNLFQQMRSGCPVTVAVAVFVPDVPFVEGEINFLIAQLHAPHVR